MKIAVIMDPLESIKTYKDSTYAMMREADARGHELYVLGAQDLALKARQVQGRCRRLALTRDAQAWYEASDAGWYPLSSFDVVLNRKDPPFDEHYVVLTWLLDLAAEQGARVLNHPGNVRGWNEKIAIARFPQFTAPTLVTADAALLREFIAAHQDVIFKPLLGMGGAGIFRVRQDDPNIGVIIETMTLHGAATIMAQRYIPEIKAGDKRILIIDGEVVPYALARIPADGETRGNLAAGGRGVAQPLSDRDREIAETLAPALRRHGLFLVGLDVIGDYLTEVNVTSPTGMQEIHKQTGFDVAGLMLDRLEAACARG